MLVCEHCEASKFLQITESRIKVDDGEPVYLEERIECTLCELTGTYRVVDDVETTTGGVVRTQQPPRSVLHHKRRANR